jgi:hypothetical protein
MKNYLLKTLRTNTINENEYLNSFIENIISLRKTLYVFSEKLPKPLGENLVTHYENRLKTAASSPMLGEYAIFLIGDLFKIPKKFINQLSFPWLLLYDYCLMLDDLIDNSHQNYSQKLLTSQITLQSALKEYNKIFENDSALWDSFNIYFNQWFAAMLFELSNKNQSKNKISNDEFLQQGRKSALVKFCASSLVILNNRRSLNIAEETCLDSICCGVQLLDDLSDIENDFNSGISNTLIIKMQQWIENNKIESTLDIKNLSLNQLKIILIFSGAITESLTIAQKYLYEGINLAPNSDGITSKYFNHIIKKCSVNIELINIVIKDITFAKVLVLLLTDELEKNKIYQIDSHKIEDIWQNINSLFLNIPKACN